MKETVSKELEIKIKSAESGENCGIPQFEKLFYYTIDNYRRKNNCGTNFQARDTPLKSYSVWERRLQKQKNL